MTLKRIVSSLGIGAGAVMIGLGLQYALAQTSGSWTAAPSSPPSNNVPAPINVGSADQAKAGWLSLGTTSTSAAFGPLDVEGVGYIKGLILGQNNGSPLQILDGNEATGSVLTSIDGSGDAGWTPVKTTHIIRPTGSGQWMVPAGVYEVKVTLIGAGGGSAGWGQDWATGAGGGGAAEISAYISVTPGQPISYSVGIGGVAGALGGPGAGGNGGPGGNTSFGPLIAGGGGGTHVANPCSMASGGVVSGISSVNAIVYSANGYGGYDGGNGGGSCSGTASPSTSGLVGFSPTGLSLEAASTTGYGAVGFAYPSYPSSSTGNPGGNGYLEIQYVQ